VVRAEAYLHAKFHLDRSDRLPQDKRTERTDRTENGPFYIRSPKNKTGAKDVLPNIHHTQASEVTPGQRRNGAIGCCVTSFAASAFHSVAAGSDESARRVFIPGDLTLTFSLDERQYVCVRKY